MDSNKMKFIFIVSDLMIGFCGTELKSDSRVIVLNSYLKRSKNTLMSMFQKMHTTNEINRKIELPFRDIWSCSLHAISFEPDVDYYVFFLGAIVKTIDLSYLKKLQERYNIKYSMILMDSWNSDASIVARNFASKLDLEYILSFDPDDCKKNGFVYINVPYSVINLPQLNNIEYDIYLIANGRGAKERWRVSLFQHIFNFCISNDVKVYYRLCGIKKRDQFCKDKVIYSERIPYSESLKETQKTNCILEVLTSGQSGPTLRYYEAVCYNKKLLTNNKNVVNLPFYNPDYIHVFEKPEDIDWEWVKERIPVDYHYDGRFSPTHLIDKIIELEEEREKKENGEKEDN